MRVEVKVLYPWNQDDLKITERDIREIVEETKRYQKAGGRVWVVPGHINPDRWRADPEYRRKLLSSLIGEVVDWKLKDGELYAVMDIYDPDIARKLQEGASASWSPGIGPVKTNKGEFSRVITHIAYTLLPYQVGLGKPVLVAEAIEVELGEKEGIMDALAKQFERFLGALRELFSLESKVITLPAPKEGELTQTRDGKPYPRKAFLFVGDPKKPSTWKLPIAHWVGGKLVVDRLKLAQAAMALGPKGFRGRRVVLPREAMSKVKAALRAWFRRLGVPEDEVKAKFPWLFEGVEEEDVLYAEEKLVHGAFPVQEIWEGLEGEAQEVDVKEGGSMEHIPEALEADVQALKAKLEAAEKELAAYKRREFEGKLDALVKELKLEPSAKAKLLEVYERNPEAAELALEALSQREGEKAELNEKEVRESHEKAEEKAAKGGPVSTYFEVLNRALDEGKSLDEAREMALEAVEKAGFTLEDLSRELEPEKEV